MTGLEIPAFVFGLSGIVTLVDKSFSVWKAITESQNFGSNLTDVLAQLSAEYYRFLSWARAVGALRLSPGAKKHPSSAARQGAAHRDLDPEDPRKHLQDQVENAVAQIVKILENTQSVIGKYKLPQGSAASAKTLLGSDGLSAVVPFPELKDDASRDNQILAQKHLAATFQSKTPLRLRLTFGSRPWKEPDKKVLEDLVSKFGYWNCRLNDMLNEHVRSSVFEQAPLGFALIQENKESLSTLVSASAGLNENLYRHAKIWQGRRDFERKVLAKDHDLKVLQRPLAGLRTSSSTTQSNIQMGFYDIDGNATIPVAVEWCRFQDWTNEEMRLASHRMLELAYTCAAIQKPADLHVLDSLGFVEDFDDQKAFGLVLKLPLNAHPSRPPASLSSLFDPKAKCRPTLGQRLHLARQVASSMHSFALVRWYHQSFSSRNIVFFSDTSTDKVCMDRPFVTGFAIARPDSDDQASLNKQIEKLSLHLHPDLRTPVAAASRPRFKRRYDLYSLGVMLFEIGLWAPIQEIVPSAVHSPPVGGSHKIVERCGRDLAFFAGVRYRDVALKCLMGPGEDEEDWPESLDSIYWLVVHEVLKCQC